MPFIARVADGTYQELKVFGNDYDTRDGTSVRNYYIHVVDLSLGILKLLKKLEKWMGLKYIIWGLEMDFLF